MVIITNDDTLLFEDTSVPQEKRISYETVERLSRIDNFENYLSSILFVQYNTTGVRMDALRDALLIHAEPEVMSQLPNPLFYAALFLSDVAVADSVQDALAVWESPEVYDAVRQFCASRSMSFTSDEEMLSYLISISPDSFLKAENSPDVYKAYKTAMLLKAVLPDNTHSEEKVNPIQMAGKAVGKLASVKYDTVRAFNESMRDGLGENADAYAADVERKKQRKAEKKAAEMQMEAEEDARQEAMRRKEEEAREREREEIRRAQERERMYERNRYSHTAAARSYNNGSGVDLRPNIPAAYLAIGVHLIIFFLLFLVNQTTAALTSIGLVIASIGWIEMKHGTRRDSRVSPATMIALGYISAAFGFFITI